MQRKTKFKIAFYTIGFLAFVLLPFALTENKKEEFSRYAPLPSYDTSDTFHPLLGRVKNAVSSLFSFGNEEENQAPQDTRAAGDISATASALNAAAAQEVLSSLGTGKTANTKTQAALAKAQTPVAGAAGPVPPPPPPAAEAQAAAEAAEAQEGASANQPLFAASPRKAESAAAAYGPRNNTLSQQGRDQLFSSVRNIREAGTKSGSSLMDTIAQSNARLARTNFLPRGPWMAAWKNKNKSSSRAGGSSRGRRGGSSSSGADDAAAARAAAKSAGVHLAGRTVKPSAATVQQERLAYQQELNDIFVQNLDYVPALAEENKASVTTRQESPAYDPVAKLIVAESNISAPKREQPVPEEQNYSATAAMLSKETLQPIETPTYPSINIGGENENDEDTDSIPLDIMSESEPVVVVIGETHNALLSNSPTDPAREQDKQTTLDISEIQGCGTNILCAWVAAKPTQLNDIYNLETAAAGAGNSLSGDPLNVLDRVSKPFINKYKLKYRQQEEQAARNGNEPAAVKTDEELEQEAWRGLSRQNYIPYNQNDLNQLFNQPAKIYAGDLPVARKLATLGQQNPNVLLTDKLKVNRSARNFTELNSRQAVTDSFAYAEDYNEEMEKQKSENDIAASAQVIAEKAMQQTNK